MDDPRLRDAAPEPHDPAAVRPVAADLAPAPPVAAAPTAASPVVERSAVRGIDVEGTRRRPAPFEQSEPARVPTSLTSRIRRLSHSSIERPGVVTAAVVLLWLGLALSAIAVAVRFSLVSAAVLEAPVLAIAFVVAFVLLALQAVLVVFVARGAIWARVALTILAVLTVVSDLISADGLQLGSIVMLVLVILLYLPRSNEWFAAGHRWSAPSRD